MVDDGWVHGDGNGWTWCAHGHRHWGVHGAAGLMLRSVDAHGEPRILMQHRASWTAHGDTWGLPGGARDSHEGPHEAALREAAEETGIVADWVQLVDELVDDHGGWSYVTVVAEAPHLLAVRLNAESEALRWVREGLVDQLRLHPGFARTWPRLRALGRAG